MTSIRRTSSSRSTLSARRGSSLACVVGVLAFAAPVVAEPVLVARVEASGVDSAAASRVDAKLRAEARLVLGERLSPLAPDRPEACAGDPACAALLATEHGVPLVLLTRYAVTGSSHQLRVGLHDSAGKHVGSSERSLRGEPDAGVLRGALYQLLSPAEYVGRLRFANVPDDVQVSVDRLALADADLRQPFSVSVGRHVVEVSAPGYAPREQEIDVAYDEELTVDAALTPLGDAVEPAAATTTSSAVPWWPAAVAGGIAGAAALTALVAGIDWAVTAQTASATSSSLGNDGSFEDHHYAASLLPSALEREKLVELRGAARTDAIIVATAGAIAVIAGAAAGGFAARWALAEDEGAP